MLLILRARLFAYTVGALILAKAGILQTPRGWIIIGTYAVLVSLSLFRILRPGHTFPWISYVDILIPSVTAIVVGHKPSSMHLLVGAQIVGALLVPRSRTTMALTLTGAFGLMIGLVLEGVTPLIPLPPEGYPLAERGAMALGMLFGAPLISILSRRNWESRKRLETYAERERRNAEVQKRLVSVASHEIRTPLASILGFAELIGDDQECSETERTEFANTIHAEAGHLSRLVNDLVDHLKLDLDRLSVKPQPMDAADVARRLILGNETRGRSISGEAIAPHAAVIGDPDRLYQVIRNLIDNAVRYGGDEIRVGFDERGDRTEIWVHDNGPGLPPGRAEELFDEYAQAASGRGLGLGLSIARRLTEAMGGTLEYDQGAPGARFVISLATAPRDAEMVTAPDPAHSLSKP